LARLDTAYLPGRSLVFVGRGEARPELYAGSGGWLICRQVAAGWDPPLELSCPLNQEAGVAWTVKVTDEYAAWFTALIKQDLGSATQVAQAVAALREEGPTLGRPLVDRLKATKIHHLKELRPGSRGRSEIRIIFAFDPTRSALLLLGGDKAGNWARWYRENIPLAEQLYIDYTADEEE
jgi:hypothetical protein